MDEYVLKTRSLTKTYRNTVALDNVTTVSYTHLAASQRYLINFAFLASR